MNDSEITEFRRLSAKRKGTITNSAPIAAALQARLDAGKAALAAAEAQATARKAAAAVQPALTTAAEFEGSPLRMTRTEFSKLSAANRARFVREGGKIVD